MGLVGWREGWMGLVGGPDSPLDSPLDRPKMVQNPVGGGEGGEGGVDILNNTLFGRVLVIFFSVVGGGTQEKEGDRELFTQLDPPKPSKIAIFSRFLTKKCKK